jgi:hypothetical protein
VEEIVIRKMKRGAGRGATIQSVAERICSEQLDPTKAGAQAEKGGELSKERTETSCVGLLQDCRKYTTKRVIVRV